MFSDLACHLHRKAPNHSTFPQTTATNVLDIYVKNDMIVSKWLFYSYHGNMMLNKLGQTQIVLIINDS